MKISKLCCGVVSLVLCLAFRPTHATSAEDAEVAFVDPGQTVYVTVDPVWTTTDDMNHVVLRVTWHNPTNEDVYIALLLEDFGVVDLPLARRTIAFPKLPVKRETPRVGQTIRHILVSPPPNHIPARGSMTETIYMRSLLDTNLLREGKNVCSFTYEFRITDRSFALEDINNRKVTGSGTAAIMVQK